MVAAITDPMQFKAILWPQVQFYRQQIDIIQSIRDSKETYVVAGNQLGKDYVAGFIALSFFLKPQLYFEPEYITEVEERRSQFNPFPHTRRVITTSIRDDHLRVLWAEIGRFIQDSRPPLNHDKGGPLCVYHKEIRLAHEKAAKNPVNYLIGCVSEKGEGLAGHHAAYTLMIGDEASGIEDVAREMGQGWAKRFLWIGNPNSCDAFFKREIEKGDQVAS